MEFTQYTLSEQSSTETLKQVGENLILTAGSIMTDNYSSTSGVKIDSDGVNTAKAEIGTSDTEKISSDGTTVDVINSRQIIPLTAGEVIGKDKIVCFKYGSLTSTKYCNGDSEVRQGEPTTNFDEDPITIGLLDHNPTGDYKREAYFKFETLPSNVQTATFKIYCSQRYGGGAISVDLYQLNADFTESSVTYNTVPATTLITGSTKAIVSGDLNTWLSWDITSTILAHQRAGTTFYGLAIRVKSGEANNWFRVLSSENNPAYLSFTLEGTDGKVYLADRDAYGTSRFIVGKSVEASTVAGQTIKVQVGKGDIMDGFSFSADRIGYPAMLTDSGGVGMTSLPRIIDYTKRNVEIGMVISTSQIVFNPDTVETLLISSETLSGTSDYWTQTNEGSGVYHYTASVYPPIMARKAIIDYNTTHARGGSSQEMILFKDSINDVTNRDANFEGTSAATTLQADWNNVINQIDLTAGNCSDSYPSATIYYYG